MRLIRKFTNLIFIISLLLSLKLFADNNYNIILKGSKNVDEEVVKSIIKNFDIEDIQNNNEILESLYNTGNFKNISINVENENLIISFQEYYRVDNVNFNGNKRFKKEEILDIFKDQDYFIFFDPNLIDQFVFELKSLYFSFGYNQIEVEYDTLNTDSNLVDLNFNIIEGKISKINKVFFIGNNYFNKNDLRSQIQSKKRNSIIIFTQRNFKHHIAKNDVSNLKNFYRKNGFKNATVELKTEYISKKNKFNIYFYINEGERFTFNDINIEYTEISIDDLQKKEINNILNNFKEKNINKKPFFNINYLEKISELFTDYLLLEGFNFFQVNILEKTEINKVDIIFEIEKIKTKYVRTINVFGNERTLDQVIRREITFSEGDPITDFLIAKTDKRLKRLNIFEKITINENYIDDENVDIDIIVKEKSTGEFNVGLSVGSLDGATFVTKLKEKNLYGTGRNGEFEINTSSSNTIYKAKIIEPFFLDKDLSFSTGIGYSEKDYSDTAAYNLNVFNINAGFNYPIIEDLYHKISLEYDLKNYEVTDASLVSSSIAASEGTNANFYLNNRLTYNKLNSFIRPTKGSSIQYVNILSPITNSTNGIIKNVFQYKKYTPFMEDEFIFSLQTKLGNVSSLQGSEINNDEKFSLGGRWLRGFDNFGVGPRKSATSYIGGNNLVVTKFDLKKPVLKNADNPIDLNIFTDIGTVFGNKTNPTNSAETIRASYGFGINFYSAIGPMGFSWGFPLEDESYDIKRMFYFSIGNIN